MLNIIKKELDYTDSFEVVERNNDFTVKEFLEKYKSKYENNRIGFVGDKLLNYKECSKYNNREIKKVYNFNDDIYTIIELKN